MTIKSIDRAYCQVKQTTQSGKMSTESAFGNETEKNCLPRFNYYSKLIKIPAFFP